MALMPEFCAHCRRHFDPSDQVVQIIELVQVETEQQGSLEVEGPTGIYHPNHLPEPNRRWREIYRGSLSGLRPAAT
jgi:hypothetical protein